MTFQALHRSNSRQEILEWVNGQSFEINFFPGDFKRVDRENGNELTRTQFVREDGVHMEFLLSNSNVDFFCEL
jgi:hypothetical protein